MTAKCLEYIRNIVSFTNLDHTCIDISFHEQLGRPGNGRIGVAELGSRTLPSHRLLLYDTVSIQKKLALSDRTL